MRYNKTIMEEVSIFHITPREEEKPWQYQKRNRRPYTNM